MVNPPFPTQRFHDIDQHPEDFRLLERIPLTKTANTWPLELSEPVGDELVMVLLDTETTGLSCEDDAIIELGMVKILYSKSQKRIVSILDVISLYEDPKRPIPEFITQLTGINDEMVAGQRIDDALVSQWLGDNTLVVAHNASFDRPFFEKRFSHLTHLPWACTARGIDWPELGFESRKLEYLLLRLGWFYEGHRASIDCLAMAWLFYVLPEAMVDMLETARRRTVSVKAFGAPFEVKDTLKEHGYRWHNGDKGANKHWWRELDEKDLIAEQAFLDTVYHQGSQQAHYDYQDARSRFKNK